MDFIDGIRKKSVTGPKEILSAGCLGTRTEMKNLNSFKAIKRAIEGERARQIECLTDGKAVIQETRRWDDNKEMSYPMRSKEDSRDYRYFPDPDLPPVTISEEWIARLKAHQPELHTEKMARYERQYRLSAYDAELLTASKHLSELFEASVAICQNPKETANWLLVEGMRLMKKYAMEMEEITFSPENLAKLVDMVDNSIVNRTAAKEIFEKIYLENVNPEAYAKEHELGVVKDEEAMRTVIQQIVKDYPKSVKDFLGGKDKAFGFLVGQVMRVMKDKADPMQVNKLLEELLKSEGKSPSLCSGEME